MGCVDNGVRVMGCVGDGVCGCKSEVERLGVSDAGWVFRMLGGMGLRVHWKVNERGGVVFCDRGF